MDETNPAPPPPTRGAPSAGVVALLALGFAPLLFAYGASLWAEPWQRGYLLAAPGAVLLGWRSARGLSQPAAPSGHWLWRGLHGLGLGLLVAATVQWSPGLGLVAALVALAGVVGWCGGWRLSRALAPAYGLLLTLLEPWAPWDALLRETLQDFIVRVVDQMLYTFEVPHLVWPGGVELPTLTVPREELFAGLAGLPGLLLVTVVVLAWLRRHPLRVFVALVALVLFAVPGETLRVARGLQACQQGARDYFQLTRAEVLTWALWLLYLALALSVDQFIGFLVEPRRRTSEPWSAPVAPPPRIQLRQALGLGPETTRLAWAFAATALLVGLAGLGLGWRQWQLQDEPARVVSALPSGAIFDVPASGGAWQALPAASVLAPVALTGRDARSWQWQNGQITLSLGLDGPLTGYADPGPGYVQRGWKIDRAQPVVSATNPVPPYVEVSMSREPMFHARLWYGVLDESGRWLEPPGHQAGWVAQPDASTVAAATHRVQALAASARPLTPAECDEARQFFDAARLALAAQLKQQAQRK